MSQLYDRAGRWMSLDQAKKYDEEVKSGKEGIEEMDLTISNSLDAKTKRFCEFCDSKGVRHKSVCPTLTENKTVNLHEEEFDL